MKRKITRLLLSAVLMMCCTVMANAQEPDVTKIEYESGKFMYFILDDANHTATVTYCEEEYTGEIQIPTTVSYNNTIYSVTSIGDYAFDDCSDLTSVTIPNSVTSIGQYAFSMCAKLASITIPNSATSIGQYAFSMCVKLASITIPNSVTSIGRNAFGDTEWYNEQQDGLLYLDNCLLGYKGYAPTGELSINAGTRVIANSAFESCDGLTSVSIPEGVTNIGDLAFSGCEKLPSVTIKGGSIGDSAFRGCIGLTSISLQEGVTNIGVNAFSDCSGIEGDLVIPSTVKNIGMFSFYECKNLQSVTIKGGSIGYSAFNSCDGLTSISLQEGVTSIGTNAFENCSGIEGDLVIPSTVKSIGDFAFSGCEKLPSVTIKGGSIGESAFSGCTGLTSISLQEGVTSIGTNAFENCSGIEGALVIPKTMTSIGGYAFRNCEKVPSVTIKGGSIGGGAFYKCTGLTSISLQEGVTNIGNDAFYGCSGIKGDLVIPSTVDCIGDNAFNGCVGLTSISLQEGVTIIGEMAFVDCSNIEGTLVIPSTITSIGYAAFRGCKKITTLYVLATDPPGLGDDAFESDLIDIPVYVLDTNDYEGWGGFTNLKMIYYFILGDRTYSLNDDGEFEGGTLTFTDKDAYLAYRDFTVEELIYSRTFANTNWQALYVPFSMEYGDWKDDFDVAAINNFHEYTNTEGNTVKTELEVRYVKKGALMPNHPYLIRAKEGNSSPQTISMHKTTALYKSTVNSIRCSSIENEYIFTGTYSPIAELKSKGYIFMSGGKLCQAMDDMVELPAQRWYLKINSLGSQIIDVGNPAKAIDFEIKVIDDEPSGIENVSQEHLAQGDGAMYNLNGMKVGKDYKGIVIKNGKKYLNK
mgnify:CR=1 FL=1